MILLCIGLFGLVFPLILAFIWKTKAKEPFYPLFIGALIFIVFAMILETPARLLTLQFASNALLFSIIGGLSAGLFEETGRFIAFKFILKKYGKKETAITYGIGHGGIECMLLVGVNYITYFIYAAMLNKGQALDPSIADAIGQILSSATPLTAIAVCLERIAAMLAHISLSILVFASVKDKDYKKLVLAILLHAGIDVFAGLYQAGAITNVWLVELLVLAYSLILAFFASKKYKTM